ncbi:DUF2069 domain-containing protein [Thaumasiovibrio sp. DFM-14]|uniref:DUF2069 domain-containing protein n=1 Tax=Thaumasiovibrio sp. DFM-14 TaxID=3384792 RepID=UPI0039A18074
MPSSSRHLHQLALLLHLSLLLFIILWHSWLSPSPHLSKPFMLTLWLVPLLFPLPGMIRGKPYTCAWANFILMLYFTHALTLLWVNEGERGLALIELLLISGSFSANLIYARRAGKAQGLHLKKLSEVEKEERQRYLP